MDKKTDRLIHLIKQAQEQYADKYFVLAVPGFISKKFIAYCAMKEDLERILDYINEIRKKPTGIIKSALSYSLIALYGKCFTDASKSSFPKLEPSELFNGEEKKYDTHNYLMELRHQFIAHRGETDNEIGISYILVAPDNIQVRFSQLKMVGFPEEDLGKFEILVNFLIEKLLEKIQKNGQKVHDAMRNLFTPEQLTFMMVNYVK